MHNFVFQNPTKIIFGKDTEITVGAEIKPYTNKILFHYGGGSIKRTGLLSLKDLNIPDDRLEEMAAKCTEKGPVGNFLKLYKDDVFNIYKLAR